jgi:hypothetical protein
MLIAGSVCVAELPAAAKVTRPPAVLRALISRSGPPLFRMTRKATVLPGTEGCGTTAVDSSIAGAALALV